MVPAHPNTGNTVDLRLPPGLPADPNWDTISPSEPESKWFSQLPLELVDLIPVCAGNLADPKDLISWCLVRRSWLKPSRAALYRTVLFASPYNCKWWQHSIAAASANSFEYDASVAATLRSLDRRVQSFCDVIDSNPALGKLVLGIDFPVTRTDQPCASSKQYKAILYRCPNIVYFRNIQVESGPLESSPVDFPKGALSKLQWIDTDFPGYEEWHESVLQPMHFLRRIRFGSPKLVRGDNHGHASFDLLNDTTLQVKTIDNWARQAFGEAGRAMLRRLAATALPNHRMLSCTYTVHAGFSRHVARAFKARMRLYSVALPNLQLYEMHFQDGSSQNGYKTYPKPFWEALRRKILEIPYPIHFAIAIFHEKGEEIADTPNWDDGEFRERNSDISEDERTAEEGGEAVSTGPQRNPHDYEEEEEEGPRYVATSRGDDLHPRETKRSRRSLDPTVSAARSRQHWEAPFILAPFSRKWEPIMLEGGLRSVPFLPAKDPHPYTMFVDQGDKAEATSRPRYEKGTMEWLRLATRNVEHGRQDFRL